MYGITVNGVDIDFLVIMTDGLADKGASTGYMSIRQDDAVLCIHNKARRFRRLWAYTVAIV